jgi:predicted TIM-barrel fold metal-dependent hydrolase
LPPSNERNAPFVDHHQHLFSPTVAALISPPPPDQAVGPILASDLVALLDAANIELAVVLSVAYLFGSPNRIIENERERVRDENDWTSEQVALFPDRLRGFCSVNPLGTMPSRSWPVVLRQRGRTPASSCTSRTRPSITMTPNT